jgi:hypothetical protein
MVYSNTVLRNNNLASTRFGLTREGLSVRPGEGLEENRLSEPIKATFEMDAELHQRLKIQAATEIRTMREIVEDGLKLYFERIDKTTPGRTNKINTRDLRPDEAKS